MLFHDEVLECYGADMLLINVSASYFVRPNNILMLYFQHGDLLEILFNRVRKSWIEVRTGKTIVSVDPSKGSVKLKSGTVITGDIIIDVHRDSQLIRPILEKTFGEEDEDMDFFANIA